MSNDTSDRPLELVGRGLGAPRQARRTLAGILAAIALAAAAQLACNGDSPTAPFVPTPRPQPNRMVVVNVVYRLLITPFQEQRSFPRSAELLVDGHPVFSGAVRPPYIYDSSYGYSYDVPASVGAQSETGLSAGTHTLSFRITDQARSPTGYHLSGSVDIYWQGYQGDLAVGQVEVESVARWQDATARLRTGQEWSIEFVVRDRSSL